MTLPMNHCRQVIHECIRHNSWWSCLFKMKKRVCITCRKELALKCGGLIAQYFMVLSEAFFNVQWVCTAVSCIHNRLTLIISCLIKSEKVNNPTSYASLSFPNSSPLGSLLSRINAVNDLHSISVFPINRNIPTGQGYAGFLTKTSYVLLAFSSI